MEKLKRSYHNSLGHLMMAFSQLENALSWLLSGLINDDARIGEIVVSQLSFNRILHVLDALFRDKINDEKLVIKLSEIIKKSSEAEAKRNSITHSNWGIWDFDSENNTTLSREKARIKIGKGYSNTILEAQRKEIHASAIFCEEVQQNIIDLIIEMHKRKIVKYLGPIELIN